MTIIQQVLKKGERNAFSDTKAFNDYNKNIISLEECRDIFFKNNEVSKENQELITLNYFKGWLNELGYGGNDE